MKDLHREHHLTVSDMHVLIEKRQLRHEEFSFLPFKIELRNARVGIVEIREKVKERNVRKMRYKTGPGAVVRKQQDRVRIFLPADIAVPCRS